MIIACLCQASRPRADSYLRTLKGWPVLCLAMTLLAKADNEDKPQQYRTSLLHHCSCADHGAYQKLKVEGEAARHN